MSRAEEKNKKTSGNKCKINMHFSKIVLLPGFSSIFSLLYINGTQPLKSSILSRTSNFMIDPKLIPAIRPHICVRTQVQRRHKVTMLGI